MTLEADNKMLIEECEAKAIALIECDNKLIQQDEMIRQLTLENERLTARINELSSL